MVFSSPLFLFYFLPFVLIVHFILQKTSIRNVFLLLASLFFYAWGEISYVLIMIFSIIINYLFGLIVAASAKETKWQKVILIMGVLVNVLILLYFKYFNFFFESIQDIGLFPNYEVLPIHLPIGISFFTFQSISYLIDIYRKEAEVQKNALNLGLYISLFPQLIAGPIIRYHDVAAQIKSRIVNIESFKEGIKRFIIGLSKKLLIADSLALFVDEVFAMDVTTIPTSIAWLGIICYALQIYYDFSGYSDMAIGIGKMLGFHFLENFNLPYISKSIQEFWRRWHISLSNWFRDYLYIPLGGNRKGKWRTYANLIIVFFITGLWHGASWNFIVWGLFHGSFLLIERLGFKKLLTKLPSMIQMFYTLMTVLVGWVFFRAVDLGHAIDYLQVMFGFQSGWDYEPIILFNNFVLSMFIVGLICATSIGTSIIHTFEKLFIYIDVDIRLKLKNIMGLEFSLFILLGLCFLQIASNSYSPFIYFRF